VKRLRVIVYRVLEVSVIVVSYLVLGLILYRAIAWTFGAGPA
jgi:hypothetical protein